MKKYFGTDGIRSLANDDTLNPLVAYMVSLALTEILSENVDKPKILIGRDSRLSGPMFVNIMSAGISSMGGDAICLGMIPTPAVSSLVRSMSADAGIVVSASHNPYYDNGIKIFGADGRKLSDELEHRIEEYINNDYEFKLKQNDEIGKIIDYSTGASEYIGKLRSHFTMNLAGLRIVIDAANGATSSLASRLLWDLGAQTYPIFKSPNGVNINEECGSTHPENLINEVVNQQADLGIAYDGDGDRVLLVDNEGNLVDGDEILSIIASYMMDNGELDNDTVVVTVMSNLGLKLAMMEQDINVVETAVGDKNVMVGMMESGAVLGGEQSGHVIISKINPTGDGIATSLLILKIMCETNKSLRELASIMTKLPQLMENVRVCDKEAYKSNERVLAAIKDAEQKLEGQGRVLIRPSGTEPLIRVMVEGREEDELKNILDEIVKVIKKEIK